MRRAERHKSAKGGTRIVVELPEVRARNPATDRVRDELDRFVRVLGCDLLGGLVECLVVEGQRDVRAELAAPVLGSE